MEYVPKEAETSWQAVNPGKDKIEMFRGVVIEDNSDLEVEQPKVAPPYHHQVNAIIIVCEANKRILKLNILVKHDFCSQQKL